MEGLGTFIGFDEDTYRGSWSFDQKHGRPDSSCYVGSWNKDLKIQQISNFSPEKENSKEMAYLLADWAASFAVGLVFDRGEKYTSEPDKVDDTGFLLVLWAPFLLLMVGGQDGITSFAVQDNELWLRHLIWLILQLSTTGFVFFQSVHQNRLWIPTLILLLAGTIKYYERTIALYLASSDSVGTSQEVIS
ncbi:hypothetical protein CFP56_016363 [Quercus suber]|uniref:DUF4220 domain-containing protein n=1 Tax=Quercus suber TaxID=58331 RepID=A0AAW0KNF0_QUESU